MSAPRVSVVVRAKDEGASIGRTLDLLAGQTVAADMEVIVVDSGSADDTVAIARAAGARVIEIPAESFTFGGSLNTGAAAAAAPVVVALSAHAFPTEPRWLERMLEAMADERVACASGQKVDAHGTPIHGPLTQDAASARAHPHWGYSNHAGAFRAELWRRRGFRADMPATEDKEWALHWLERGYVAIMDPGLDVEHSHGHDPLRDQFHRAFIQWQGYGMFNAVAPQPVGELLRTWWTDQEGYASPLRARLSPSRLARLGGSYAGRRAASRRS